MNHTAETGWIDANQALVAAELACLRARLTGRDPDTEPAARVAAAAAAMPTPAAIDLVVAAFGLSPFERALLLLCAGVEMDAQLADACAATSGRPCASFGLALAALAEPHWSALT